MSYLAIARKYRPSTFDEIVGQAHVTRTLKNALAKNRIHHAFLFCGARGVGKTTAARALARALNCEQGPTADPCGTCGTCLELLSGTAPDLIEIDGASNNSVDDIRDLRETVKYAPTRGKYKVYLIDEVHMLSKAAFNALLKTLEEPPPHVVFIFATTEPNKILDTILSRVQRFDFKRIPVPAIVDHLRGIAKAEGASLSDTGLKLIARAGEGSMRDAQSLLDKVISFGDDQISDADVAETLGLIDQGLLHEMLTGLVQGDPARCLAAIESVYGYGYELAQFTGELLELLRNATFLRLSAQARQYVDLTEDEIAALDAILTDVPAEVLTRIFTAMVEVHDQVSHASRPRILLDMAVARLATTRPLQPIGDLVQRLEGLERSLRRTGSSPAPRSKRTRAPAPAQRSAPPAATKTAVQAPTSSPKPSPKPPPTDRPEPPKAQSVPSHNDPERTLEERWGHAIDVLGEAGEPLSGASVLLHGDVLSIEVVGAAAAARINRVLRDESTRAVVVRCLGREVPDKVVMVPPRESKEGAELALRRRALSDPRLNLIMQTLDAKLIRVEPAGDDDVEPL